MGVYICPMCKNGGGVRICKECSTMWCTYCKKTLQGVKYDTLPNQCPICKKFGTDMRTKP